MVDDSRSKSAEVFQSRRGSSPKPKDKGGQPTKYNPDYCRRAKKLCSKYGATEEQLAIAFGVTTPTIQNWMYYHKKFFIACRDGWDESNVRKVEKALAQRAVGWECDETREEHTYIKQGKGKEAEYIPARKVIKTHKCYAPDPMSAIFLLVNRSRHSGRWQNISNIQITGEDGGPVKTVSARMDADEATSLYMDMLKRGAPVIHKNKNRHNPGNRH